MNQTKTPLLWGGREGLLFTDTGLMDKMVDKLRQTQRIRPNSGKDTEVLQYSRFIEEELPLPYVLYPNLYGTFIGFAPKANGQIFFCSCMEPAICNYFELVQHNLIIMNSGSFIINPLLSYYFPPIIAEMFDDHNTNPEKIIIFKDKICHKCNLATPTVRAMHSMYGGKFKQYYGWYIKQQYFHLGILQNGNFLKDKCPDEIIDLLTRSKRTQEAANKERIRLNEMVYGPKRDDILDDEITYWSNVKMEESDNYRLLDKESKSLKLNLSYLIENIVRKEFGFRKVGDGWIGESILFKIVQRLFPDKQIIRHYRPVWLDGLELDIYIPDIELAFEYQGQQHYHPIKAWGGKKELEKLIERDKKKRLLCIARNVQLIAVDYTEPLTEKHIRQLIDNEK